MITVEEVFLRGLPYGADFFLLEFRCCLLSLDVALGGALAQSKANHWVCQLWDFLTETQPQAKFICSLLLSSGQLP